MSHTIGQVKEDNQQSNSNSSQANQEPPKPEEKASRPISPLKDADYEFLFNQLLEGIAHGWHDHRITKFFNQLGDRGQQKDWIAWLERLRVKVLTLPIQSKRQLGTMMIRLGELTQSASEVKEIGATSNQIGRELLFGNNDDVVWEYVGPDSSRLETDQNLSSGLPNDFSSLGSTSIEETENNSASVPIITETAEPREVSEDLTTISSSDNSTTDSTNSEEITTYSEEFEFEEASQESEQLEQVNESPANLRESHITESDNESSNQEQPESVTDSEFDSLLSLIDGQSSDLAESESESNSTLESLEQQVSDPVAIDVQQVMSLIQEDEELAQKISEKLNVSLVKLDNLTSQTLEHSTEIITGDLDQSSLELIESWFNLGLKQVSAGEFEKAIISWDKALKINPNLSEAWHNRGSALGRLGKYEEAVDSFGSALAIDPYNYQAWNDRAHALYQLQKWTEAVNSWNNAIKITPGNHLFWYNCGCALEQLESWGQAISNYEKSLEIKPDFQPARSRYINLVADNSR